MQIAFQQGVALRERLLLLFDEAVDDAKESGLPLVRPMWWASPLDERVATIEDQFLVGDALVLAPILQEGAASRSVYLPSGVWVPCVALGSAHATVEVTVTGPTWFLLTDVNIYSIPCYYRSHSNSTSDSLKSSIEYL